MFGGLKKHLAATFSAVCALLIAGSLTLVYSQSAQMFLANALHVDGDAIDAPNDRGILIAGTNGVSNLAITTDAAGDLQVDVVTSGLPTGAATEVTLALVEGDTSAIQTAVQVMDDWDETNRAAVNLIAGQAGITAGSAAIAATTPSVTLATNDPAVVDLAALEVLSTAANVDLAALEVLSTAANVDLAAMEVLQTSIEGDTSAIQTSVQIMDDWDDATSIDHAKVVPAQAVPQVPVTVACDDTGIIAFTANAADNRLSIINTSTTLDVCVRFGSTTGADRTTLTTCTFVLGAYSGAGTTEVYETPQGMRIGGEAFACDSGGTANLAVTAWRNP